VGTTSDNVEGGGVLRSARGSDFSLKRRGKQEAGNDSGADVGEILDFKKATTATSRARQFWRSGFERLLRRC